MSGWTWGLIAIIVIDMAIRIAAVIIIPRNRRPTAAMAWLLAIYFIPLIGVFLFLLIGLLIFKKNQDKFILYI